MPNSRWRSAALLCTVLTMVGLACATPAERPQPAEGSAPEAAAPRASTGPRRLTAGIRGTAQVLYAKLNIGNAGLGVADTALMVNAGLTARDDQEALHAQLAEAVPTVDNGAWKLLPDGRMETTWKIRENARWHDGTPFTSDDLVFTYQVSTDRELPVFGAAAFESIEAVEAPDPRTVVVRWKQAFVHADQMFGTGPGGLGTGVAVPLPEHLLQKPYTDDKLNLPQHPYFTVDFVGTGPFRVKQFVPDSFITLTANDDFVLGRPRIDEIEIKFIPDANTILANLLAGQIQLILDPRSITSAQALQIKDQWTDGHFDFGRASWVVMYPQNINPTPAAMTSVRFRRALMHAINRQEMADSAPIPVTVADTWIGPDWAQYKDVESSIVRYPFDLQRAAQLLQEEGFTRGADGTYQDAAGTKLHLELRAPGTDINMRSALTVADYWQRAGIGAEMAVVPPQRTNDREYRSTFPGVELIRPTADLDTFTSVRSSDAPLPETNWAGNNRQRYRSAELDSIIDRYLTTIPPAPRSEALKQAVRYISDQLVYMGLIFDPPVLLVANRVQNVPPAGLWNGHQWTITP